MNFENKLKTLIIILLTSIFVCVCILVVAFSFDTKNKPVSSGTNEVQLSNHKPVEKHTNTEEVFSTESGYVHDWEGESYVSGQSDITVTTQENTSEETGLNSEESSETSEESTEVQATEEATENSSEVVE